jgi:SOS-response transcriptional repressor LexA
MTNDKPTKKQTTLLEFIRDFTAEHEYSPSYREIQSALGLRSVSAVAEHVNNCIERGFLRKIPGTARSLEIVPPRVEPDYIAELEYAIKHLHATNRHNDADKVTEVLRILNGL